MLFGRERAIHIASLYLDDLADFAQVVIPSF